ncbi:MAG TPA: hypothetical protein VLF91_05250 [Candidatus Saccharimonadales bacterium]|nr:hypothetical protein [Candidatus Saccharimonadales bacterium]
MTYVNKVEKELLDRRCRMLFGIIFLGVLVLGSITLVICAKLFKLDADAVLWWFILGILAGNTATAGGITLFYRAKVSWWAELTRPPAR